MKRVYLFVLTITLLAITVFSYTIWKLPPELDTGEIIIKSIAVFALSLTLSITGSFTFVIFLFRKIILKPDSPRVIFRQSLREGFFVALVSNGVLILQKIQAITILNITLLTFIFITLETYLLLKTKDTQN